MGDNRGQHPNSKANLLKGMPVPKMMYADGPSQRLANSILDEETDYEGTVMTVREAILRTQVYKALNEGDLRACQFLIELAGRNEQNDSAIKKAVVSPLDQLSQMMQKRKIDDRRKKAD